MQQMEEIYKQYADTVYRYLLTLTRSPDTAEELTQETFYQAIRSSNKFDGSCKVSTWLCAISKRVYLTYLRKHPAEESIDELPLTAPSAENAAIERAGRAELLRRLHDLPEPYREVAYLRALGGLSFGEIGEVLGKTENWARVTYFRGKEKLRKDMDENG